MQMGFGKLVLVCAMLTAILAGGVSAFDYVLSNSADWRDVYSSMMFANVGGTTGSFLASMPHAAIMPYSLSRDWKILLVNSKTNPYAVGYKNTLQAQGFNVEEITSDSINLVLARNLTKITNFVIMDDRYGYDAISVAPYAVAKKAFVLFANKKNLNQIAQFLSTRNVDELLIYGQVDREVRVRLSSYNPIVINTGDRYSNNVEVVKRYMQIKGASQFVFSNGEFIEAQLLSGTEPVLFIGNANIPQQTSDYIKSSGVKVGVLIGNELVGTATLIRRQLGISVFVKFGRGARTPKGAITTVEDLDRFPLPMYAFKLTLYSLRFNQATNQLEVTYHNEAPQATYFKGTITLRDLFGTQTVGDVDAIFMDGYEYKTVVYDIKALAENATAEVFTIYGESPKSLEYVLRQTVPLERISIVDNSALVINGISYDRGKAVFYVDIENKGTVKLYTILNIKGLIVNDEARDYGSQNVTGLLPGERRTIAIAVDQLTDYDISQNPTVTVLGYYGERDTTLVKTVSAEFPFKLAAPDFVFYGLVALVIIILLFVLLRKKCRECGAYNFRFRQICRNCGADI